MRTLLIVSVPLAVGVLWFALIKAPAMGRETGDLRFAARAAAGSSVASLVTQNPAPHLAAPTVSGASVAPVGVRPSPKSASPDPTSDPARETGKWYAGGTLSTANGLDWQKGTPQDKLATCADFLAALWMKRSLKPALQAKITSIDDLKPLAAELRTALDKAFSGSKNPKENHQLLVNQKAADTAVLLMSMMGWV